MEHDTITISQATAVATPDPTVVMPPAGGAVAIGQETAAERKPPDAVAARPDPAQAPELELLGNQIAELSARIDAATYDLLCHLHEFDRRYGWEGWRSCAHWLNWRTGLDLGAAREKLRVATALADLNHVSAAMARGQLSYSKVRALTRVASPATEAPLLAVALCATAAQVERLVRAWRQVDRDAQPDAAQVLLASRTLSMQVDEDGMVVLRGRLPPEVGALLLRAVQAAMEQVPASAEGGEPTIAQRRADALGLVAESALAGGLDPGNPADRFQVTVHVQADALPARDPADAGPHVSAETRGLSPALSEPVAPAGPRVAAESREVGLTPSAALAPARPRVAAETRVVGPAPSVPVAPAGPRVAAETRVVGLTPAAALAPAGSRVAAETHEVGPAPSVPVAPAGSRVAAETREVGPAPSEPVAPAGPRVAAETREVGPAPSAALAPARPRVAAETREVSPASSVPVAPAGPRVAAETREVSLTPSEAVAPAASLVAAHSARERTGGGRADRAAGPGVTAESARSPRGTSGRESRSADTDGWCPLCEESAPRPRDAKDPNHQEDRSTGIACRASLSEQATIATPHISAETFEASEAAFERLAPETDLDSGLAVIEQAGGLHLGKEAARRVACDAGIVVLRHGAGGEVLDVGRRTRTVPSAMRRALLSRDHGQCQFPGCESRHCDAHHVEHWADGGETRLQNLVLACRFHHRALHEEGFRVVPGDADGRFRFLRPDGTPLPAEPPVASWEGAPLAPTEARLAAAGVSIGPHTATPEWYGESLDLTAALDVLWEPPAAVARGGS